MLQENQALPKISIITVTLNSAKTLEGTIQSLINQKYPNLEYIIIDGVSNDDTLKIVERYSPYIDKFISEPDRGIYDAMNKGIKMSTGEIIGIINSDDIYLEKAIDKIVHAALKHPYTDVFYGNVLYEIPETSLLRVCSKYPLKKSSFYYMPIIHPTVFIRRRCYEKYGLFDINYKLSADCDLMLRLVEANVQFYYINDEIVKMRSGGASNQNLNGLKEIYTILNKHHASLDTFYQWLIYFFKTFIILSVQKYKIFHKLIYQYQSIKYSVNQKSKS